MEKEEEKLKSMNLIELVAHVFIADVCSSLTKN